MDPAHIPSDWIDRFESVYNCRPAQTLFNAAGVAVCLRTDASARGRKHTLSLRWINDNDRLESSCHQLVSARQLSSESEVYVDVARTIAACRLEGYRLIDDALHEPQMGALVAELWRFHWNPFARDRKIARSNIRRLRADLRKSTQRAQATDQALLNMIVERAQAQQQALLAAHTLREQPLISIDDALKRAEQAQARLREQPQLSLQAALTNE